MCSCLQCPQLSELVRFLLWEQSVAFYLFHRHSLPSWSCGFNLQLVRPVGRFWVFFLSHTAPGFQLWFSFHLCMWVVHWGLLLMLPWRLWVWPWEGQVWRWCSCLGRRGSGSTRYSAGWQPGQKEIQCSRGIWQPVLANRLQYSCLEKPLSDREAWQATVCRVAKSWTRLNLHRRKTFSACGSPAPVRAACEGGPACWLAGTLVAPSVQGHGLPPPQELWPCQSLFEPLVAGDQKASLASLHSFAHSGP